MVGRNAIPQALKALADQGFEVKFQPPKGRRGPRQDGRILIGDGRNRLEWVAEAKGHVTPATLGALVAHFREIENATGERALLVTDHVTPPVAEKLRELGRQFVDAAGNAYLQGPGLYVWVVGRKLEPGGTADPTGQAFTKAGLKTVFALICDPRVVTQPMRAIAATAGVALGAVPRILADLQTRGDLAVAGRNRRLNGTKRLLDEWAATYARVLRPKTLMGIYAAPNIRDWKGWDLARDAARWGGEPAAHLLIGHLVPGILTLYVDRLPVELTIAHRLKTARHAQGELVEVRRRFWGDAVPAGTPRPDVVPVPLIYADLLATGDARCIETAQLIYEKLLAGPFPKG